MKIQCAFAKSVAASAVLSVFIALAPTAHAEVTGNTVVDARMRAGPSTSSPVVSGVTAYDTIYNIQETGRYYQGHQWLRVTYRGRVGYVWGAMICTSVYINGSQQCNNRSSGQAQPQNQPPNAGWISYSCGNNGASMVVTYREEGNESVAYVQYSGKPQVRMVKPWGSNGDQYYNGNNGIFGRNGQLTYQSNGRQTQCHKQ